MGRTKLCDHPPPSTTTQHHPPPAKIYPPPLTTTYHQPIYIHQHPPPPTNSQSLFYKKPIYKNLWPLSDGNVRNPNSRPAIAKKLFLHGALHYFYCITRNCSKKLQCEQTFILCETSFEKRQVFRCWKYSGVKVWQSHFNSLIKRLFNFHAVFSNSDRKRYISEAAIGDLQLY